MPRAQPRRIPTAPVATSLASRAVPADRGEHAPRASAVIEPVVVIATGHRSRPRASVAVQRDVRRRRDLASAARRDDRRVEPCRCGTSARAAPRAARWSPSGNGRACITAGTGASAASSANERRADDLLVDGAMPRDRHHAEVVDRHAPPRACASAARSRGAQRSLRVRRRGRAIRVAARDDRHGRLAQRDRHVVVHQGRRCARAASARRSGDRAVDRRRRLVMERGQLPQVEAAA